MPQTKPTCNLLHWQRREADAGEVLRKSVVQEEKMLVVPYHVTGQLLTGDPVIVGHMTRMMGGGRGLYSTFVFTL